MNMNENNDFGFIILRHINSEITNTYWKNCYRSIRNYYPTEKILIIDDNSNKKYVKNGNLELINTEIIESEYPGCGELLPYYYFYKLRPFKKMMFLHDSMILNKRINYKNIENKMLWHIGHHRFDKTNLEINLIKLLKGSEELIKLYKQKHNWNGCFGVTSIVTLDYMDLLEDKYDIFVLVNYIKKRMDRMCLERIYGFLMMKELGYNNRNNSLFGDILKYPYSFKVNISNILQLKSNLSILPIIKIWSGR